MTDDPLILWLDHGSAPGNPLLGGKFASLAEMTAAGFSVPPGFGVTTAAYRAFMEHADLQAWRQGRCAYGTRLAIWRSWTSGRIGRG